MPEFHKIWIEQCEAARDIPEEFGLQKALGHLIGEKLLNFLRTVKHAGMFPSGVNEYKTHLEDFNFYRGKRTT